MAQQPCTYTFSNAKGGVAKTTTAIQLGYELAILGHPVLLCDGDSQRSLTMALGLEPKPGQPTMYALLTEPAKGIRHIVRTYTGTVQRPVAFPGHGRLDLLPGAKQITAAPAAFERSRDRQPVNSFEQVLPWVFTTFCEEYDYIICDPSPSSDPITEALALVAHRIIAPVASEMMALDGLQELLDALRQNNERRAGLQLPGQTELHGILIAKVLPDQLELVARMRETFDRIGISHFGDLYVPYTTAGWKAPGARVPIAIYQPDDAAAATYHEVAATL